MKSALLFLCLLLAIESTGQVENLSVLTIDQIMHGDEFVGYLPTSINWSDNSQFIYFSWNPDKDTLRSTYKADIASKNIENSRSKSRDTQQMMVILPKTTPGKSTRRTGISF